MGCWWCSGWQQSHSNLCVCVCVCVTDVNAQTQAGGVCRGAAGAGTQRNAEERSLRPRREEPRTTAEVSPQVRTHTHTHTHTHVHTHTHRGTLKNALSGRDEKSLVQLQGFLLKYVHPHTHTHTESSECSTHTHTHTHTHTEL